MVINMKQKFFDEIYGNYTLSCYAGTIYSSKDDFYFLKKYNAYSCDCIDEKRPAFYFENKESKNLRFLNRFFGIDEIMGNGSELENLSRLKKWANIYFHFNGKRLPGRIYDGVSCVDLVNKAKNDGYALNCRYISLAFTQILLSAGFCARWVICNSMDLRDEECHCVTEVYVNQLGKWIVVDPSFGLFYFNKNGELLSLIEMRKMIAEGEKIRFYSNSVENTKTLQLYWLKNIFRFSFCLSNTINMLCTSHIEYACLNPEGFKMEDRTIITPIGKVSYKYYYNDRLFTGR